jgi:WD40 repeat protein
VLATAGAEVTKDEIAGITRTVVTAKAVKSVEACKLPCTRLKTNDTDEYIAIGGCDGSVSVFHFSSLQKILTTNCHDFSVTGLGFAPSSLVQQKGTPPLTERINVRFFLMNGLIGYAIPHVYASPRSCTPCIVLCRQQSHWNSCRRVLGDYQSDDYCPPDYLGRGACCINGIYSISSSINV